MLQLSCCSTNTSPFCEVLEGHVAWQDRKLAKRLKLVGSINRIRYFFDKTFHFGLVQFPAGLYNRITRMGVGIWVPGDGHSERNVAMIASRSSLTIHERTRQSRVRVRSIWDVPPLLLSNVEPNLNLTPHHGLLGLGPVK